MEKHIMDNTVVVYGLDHAHPPAEISRVIKTQIEKITNEPTGDTSDWLTRIHKRHGETFQNKTSAIEKYQEEINEKRTELDAVEFKL